MPGRLVKRLMIPADHNAADVHTAESADKCDLMTNDCDAIVTFRYILMSRYLVYVLPIQQTRKT